MRVLPADFKKYDTASRFDRNTLEIANPLSLSDWLLQQARETQRKLAGCLPSDPIPGTL